MVELNIDRIDSFFDCPQKWYYTNIEKDEVATVKDTDAIRQIMHRIISNKIKDKNFEVTKDFASNEIKNLNVVWSEKNGFTEEAALTTIELLAKMVTGEILPQYKFVHPTEYTSTKRITSKIKLNTTLECVLEGYAPILIQNEKSKKLEVCLFSIGSGTTVTTNGNVSTDSYGIRGAFLLKLLKHFEQSCGTLKIADSLDLDKIHVIGIQIAKTSTGIRWAKKYIKINPNIFQKCITNIINTKEYYGNPKSKTCTVNYCSCYNNCEYRDITLENIKNY